MTIMAEHTTEQNAIYIEQEPLQVIASGGTGLNIASQLDETFDVTMFDLTNSNFTEEHFDNDENKILHIIKGKDGTGKIREEAYAAFESRVEDFVATIPMRKRPVILLSSLGGGTGATFNTMIANELVARGSTVIIIGVCNTVDLIQLRNTVKSIYSYRNLVEALAMPIPMMFFDNESETEVNEEVLDTIRFLDQITDKNVVSSFDTEDMKKSLYYTIPFRETAPELTFLTRTKNEALPNKAYDPDRHVVISSVLVVKDQNKSFVGIEPMYTSKAVVRNKSLPLDNERLDNIVGIFDDVLGLLETDLSERESKLKRTPPTTIKKRPSSKGNFIVL